MDYNKRFDQIENLLTDLLQGQEQQTQRFDSMIRSFDTFGNAVLSRMDTLITEIKDVKGEVSALRNDMKRLEDHETRLRKIEEYILRKGA